MIAEQNKKKLRLRQRKETIYKKKKNKRKNYAQLLFHEYSE